MTRASRCLLHRHRDTEGGHQNESRLGQQHQHGDARSAQRDGEDRGIHGSYLPLCRARRMLFRSLLISASLRSTSDILSNAVTACSGESPKYVLTTWARTSSRAVSVGLAG